MASPFIAIDRLLQRLTKIPLLGLALACLLGVGALDYLSGHEVSISLFYLGPVALAAWYVGGPSGIIMAVLACLSWYLADRASGHVYTHPAIPIWNALVRFGFFIITALLLGALRSSYRKQLALARLDALTGLSTRHEFEGRLKHEVAISQRRKGWLTLAYVDMDNFKTVNDTYGHQGGDRVLRAVSHCLRASIRETDLAARLGGDEFALLLPDTDPSGAQRLIARLQTMLAQDPLLKAWAITCSMGIVTFQDPDQSPEQMLAGADALMYEVKHNGKASVAFQTVSETEALGSIPA